MNVILYNEKDKENIMKIVRKIGEDDSILIHQFAISYNFKKDEEYRI